MYILGIETSCDETAVAIVSSDRKVLAHQLYSQNHQQYGGVVPEVSARAHLQHLDSLAKMAIADSQIDLADLSAVAATIGPGLIGGLLVGSNWAKGFALAHNKPFIGINHLEAHALVARLDHDAPFPFLLFLISGGHCQLLLSYGLGKYRLLGQTLDDAVGECYDKAAKLLGLGYPGGPAIEALAQHGRADLVDLPAPMLGKAGCDLSFSGLKTAVSRQVQKLGAEFHPHIAAKLQQVIGIVLCDRLRNAILMARADSSEGKNIKHIVIAGGVAANQYLRAQLKNVAEENELELVVPPPKLCTDNAVMIAWAGMEYMTAGPLNSAEHNLLAAPRPTWPL